MSPKGQRTYPLKCYKNKNVILIKSIRKPVDLAVKRKI